MGKINGCLRGLFISFNTLFAILGCVFIVLAIKSGAYSHELLEVDCLVWIWLFTIGVIGISCLGICAGASEKEIILKIFAGFMGVGMILILIFGIVTVVERNKINSSLDSPESFMKDEKLRALLDGLQQKGQCCGVAGPSDWGDNIPNSCECSRYGYGGYGGYGEYGGYGFGFGGLGCTSKPQGVSGPDRIYAEPCKYSFMENDLVLVIALGVFFGFAVIALLGLLLTLLMIHQVRRYDCSGGSSIAMRKY